MATTRPFTRLFQPRVFQQNITRRFATPFRSYATTQNLENIYDIVIVGGGIAGTALACSLAANPTMRDYRVALIEAMDLSNTNSWTPIPNQYSNRVVSLTPHALKYFSKIGVTDQLYRDRLCPYSRMQVWDGVTDARIEFDTALLEQLGINLDEKDTAIAYMVENVHLQHAILKHLEACRGVGASVDTFQKVRVEDISLEKKNPEQQQQEEGLDLADWPVIELNNGMSLKARLLVGADGINSPVRSFANIESLGWDYNMHGVVATFKVDSSRPCDTSFQRFLPTGPIAMLPLANGYASMVWSSPPHIATKLKKMPADAFCTLVNAAFRLSPADLKFLYSQLDKDTFEPTVDFQSEFDWRQKVNKHGLNEMEVIERELSFPPLVKSVEEKSRASFPLRLRNSQSYFANRVVLVGDAAHTVHPLAGQGLNQGILDVECLADVLQQGAANGQDIGNIHLLREYASVRYLRNLVMISACDKLHRLYTTDFAPVTWIRSLGLSAVNSLDFVKAEIMKYAMGIEYTGTQSGQTQEQQQQQQSSS
ncbi:hypothetical protein BDB00DRAFT_854504 [Zychaea mexicana]|uniref:uncharacterized protein n=1 Tax=Zychaea mexicana TaxID=64656 RepID=UPI0022FDF322|nr:uncharacterized protein BDB00DRAFT_854504 [Zychaea mexicana]KAI9484584.1 hypothetical protein BDB00DRAFT_854504 [Zychaea mexicana]